MRSPHGWRFVDVGLPLTEALRLLEAHLVPGISMRTFALPVIALFVAGPAHAQVRPHIDLEPIEVAAGDGEMIRGERGLLEVPLVRSDPDGRTIQVEVHRFHALPETPDAPPVVLLHGGPGWPGLARSLGNEAYVRGTIMRYIEVADLIVVGQRGIGSSPPNTACPRVEGWRGDLSQPTAADEIDAVIGDALLACRAHWEEQGYDLRGFNVIEAAADVNDVRIALGYDRISIWGVSFGSHWGMAVMRFHPEIVERAVLSGMEGPDHTYDSPGGVLTALEHMAASAESAPSLAPLIPEGGLIAGLRRTIRELDEDPVMVQTELDGAPVDVTLVADDLRGAALGYTARASSRRGMRTWPADMLRVLNGDWAGLAATVARQRQRGPSLPTASFWMLDCGSGITPERRARYAADPAQEVVGDPGGFYDRGCPHWDSDLGDEFRQNFSTEIPTLIVHGEWDTSTPLGNALELAPFFENSAFVRVAGGSHGALNEVIRGFPDLGHRIQRFLSTGDLSGFPERVSLPSIDWVVPEIR